MIQKWLYLGNCQFNLLQNLTQCSWECALPLVGVIFMVMTSWGAYRCMKHTQDTFSSRKTRKDTTRSVPIVFPGCPVSCMTVIQYVPSFLERNNVQKKLEFLERQEFIAQSVATMMYYEDTSLRLLT